MSLGDDRPPADSRSGEAVEQIAIAAAAALAARAVPGVVRLQPGVLGLLKQLAAQAWERTTGRPAPDTAGVDVQITSGGAARVDVRIVTAATHSAADVGAAVHSAVTSAVESATGHIAAVGVRIVAVDLEPHHG